MVAADSGFEGFSRNFYGKAAVEVFIGYESDEIRRNFVLIRICLWMRWFETGFFEVFHSRHIKSFTNFCMLTNFQRN